ncbi:MAG: hypothetical protein FWD71_21930 [Oscillospiraceae bacterium]|nr:hypothetical protein [Oscillospiraceae bacterium]
MIERQQNVYSWKFLFLGANIDSFSEANSLGISGAMTANYEASPVGTQSLYGAVVKVVNSVRSRKDGKIDENWAKDIKKKK